MHRGYAQRSSKSHAAWTRGTCGIRWRRSWRARSPLRCSWTNSSGVPRVTDGSEQRQPPLRFAKPAAIYAAGQRAPGLVCREPVKVVCVGTSERTAAKERKANHRANEATPAGWKRATPGRCFFCRAVPSGGPLFGLHAFFPPAQVESPAKPCLKGGPGHEGNHAKAEKKVGSYCKARPRGRLG